MWKGRRRVCGRVLSRLLRRAGRVDVSLGSTGNSAVSCQSMVKLVGWEAVV